MRKERGHVGILGPLTTPQFWRCTPGTRCSPSLTKAGLVGVGGPGGGPGGGEAPAAPCPARQSGDSAGAHVPQDGGRCKRRHDWRG